MPKLVNIEPNQRVDIADYTSLTDGPSDHAKHPVENFLTNPVGTRTWVVSGFGITNPAGQQIEIAKGVAILSTKEGGQTRYGYLTSEGDATKTVDISSFANGTYSIYIRFEYQDGDSGSRVFWNAAGLGSEFAQVVNTRRVPNWSVRIEASNPGSDWLKIGEVVKSGGAPAITDQRPHYFEGAVDASYANTWGGGSDRDSDRATNGVKDFQTFTEMVRTKLEELQGSGGVHRWWTAPGHGIYDTQKSDDFWKDSVATGLTTGFSGGLNGSVAAGVAYAGGVRVVYGGSGVVAFPDNQDTYVDLVNDGTISYASVANGAAQPALTANAVRLSKVVATGGVITGISEIMYRGPFAQGTSNNRLGVSRISTDAVGPIFSFRKGRGSGEVPTLPSVGDDIGGILFQVYDANGWNTGANIRAEMDGTPADGDLPTRLSFGTITAGTAVLTERMRITQSGIARIGDQSSFAETSGPLLQAVGGQTPVRLYNDSATAADRASYVAQKSRASGAVSSGDILGGFASGGRYGAGASDWASGSDGGAEVLGRASEAWSGGARGTDLTFYTTRTGAVASELRGELLGSGSTRFSMPLTSNNFELAFPNSAGYQFLSTATGAFLLQSTLDDNGAHVSTSIAGRYIEFQNNGNTRLGIDSVGVIAGATAFTQPAPSFTINTPTFGIADLYAALGSSATNSKYLTEHKWSAGTSTQYVREYAYRHGAGSDWTTASHYIHFQTDTTPQGFMRFGGSATIGYGLHVGLGVGTISATPTFGVTATDAYLEAGALLRWNNPTTTANTAFGTVKADGYTGKLVGGDGTNSVRYVGTVFAGNNSVVPSGTLATITIPANTLRQGSIIRCYVAFENAVGPVTATWQLNGNTCGTQTVTTGPRQGVLSSNLHVVSDPAASVNIGYGYDGHPSNAADAPQAGSGNIAGIPTNAAVTITLTAGAGLGVSIARVIHVEIT